MLVRVMYEVPDDVDINPLDPDVIDVFDYPLLEEGNQAWNQSGMINWPTGFDALHGTVYGGQPRGESWGSFSERHSV